MKKYGIILPVLLLLLLPGCRTEKNPVLTVQSESDSALEIPTTFESTANLPSQSSGESTGINASASPQTGTSTPAISTVSTPQTFPLPDPTYEPKELYQTADGHTNLYWLNIDGVNPDPDFFVDSASIWGDRLLLSTVAYYYEDMPEDSDWEEPKCTIVRQVYLIGLRTGKLIGSLTLDSDIASFGFLDDGTVYSSTLHFVSDNREMIRYNSSLTPTDRFDGSDCPENFCGIAGNGDLWFYDPEKGILYDFSPFGSGKNEYWSLPGYAAVEYAGQSEDSVSLVLMDTNYSTSIGILDTLTGNLSVPDSLRNMSALGDGRFLKESASRWILISKDTLHEARILNKTREYEMMYAEANNLMLTGSSAHTDDPFNYYYIYELYRLEDGMRINRIDDPLFSYLTFLCMDNAGNAVFSSFDEENGTRLLYWEGTKDTDPLPSSGFCIMDLTRTEDECTALEQKIYDRYGVHVYYDEYSLLDLVPDYICTPLKDSLLIKEGLECFYDYMKDYPEGFFDDLSYSGRLEFYLCDSFIPVDEAGISTAGALTYTGGPDTIIAVSLKYMDIVEQSLAHELMHAMERRIQTYSYTVGLPLLDFWYTLNPEGFSYYNSYHDKDGYEVSDTRYTLWESYQTGWFIDPYSTTYPTEDRARILEYLYKNFTECFGNAHMEAKAKYLCAMIRAAFPSVSEADQVRWEMFGEISLEDYRDALEDYQNQLYGSAA